MFLLFPVCAFAQTGWGGVFSFLNNNASARMAAMGGNMLAIDDNDLSIALINPSLINSEMNNTVVLNYTDFYTDIKSGFAAYSHTFDKAGSFAFGMQFVNYGNFIATNENGDQLGSFGAGEYAASLGWGRRLDSTFSIGANLKFAYSSFDVYNSYGIVTDVAALYHSPGGTHISLLVRNIGRELKSYESGYERSVPIEIQLGISRKLEHLPLRYNILLHDLQRWNLRYDDPSKSNTDPLTGETVKQDRFINILDEGVRHVILGFELMPIKRFVVRFGYNPQLRKELKLDTRASTVGFSWGFGIRIKKISIDFARSTWHLNGSPNYFTLSANLSDFLK
ncbi:MAG: type IX secretion system protein PorQ [Bacteroidota bacterium]|nr:type IX secretion system protein PorQ [Bacteroidota bacterium]